MARRETLALFAALAGIGALWGITQPFAVIAVSEGYRHVGIIFWQFALGAVFLGLVLLLRPNRRAIPLGRREFLFFLIIALIGTLLPNTASYTAAVHLPSGILSICLSTVPMLAFPIALAWGMDRFSAARLTGLLMGFAAMCLIALPEASLPDPAMALWLPMALIAPAFYALEGNVVQRYGIARLDPLELLFGASVTGLLLAAPLALALGEWISPLPPWGAPEAAILGSAMAHAVAYAGYVWIVGRAGAVFAAQVSYLVTGFGILWAKLILGESYSPWVWAALILIVAGLALVQPRPRLAEPAE